MKTYDIALIPGDGVGPEVIDAAIMVLDRVAAVEDLGLRYQSFDWSCEKYLSTGAMMPADGIAQLKDCDAILLGAVGWPAKVPDSVSLHGLLLPLRKEFDLYVNMRPHRLLAGVAGPLRSEGFDILCIRENTEGEYSGAGGRVHHHSANEVAVETAISTRHGVERILRHAFAQAMSRRRKLASVTKSNAQKHTMVFWDEVTDLVAADFPEVVVRKYHVDAIAARMITHPQDFDVIVASNLFGDILSDIGAAIQGGLGFAASANINPDRQGPSMFEPVHGSAPDIAGTGTANPLAAIWSGALMLSHLKQQRAHDRIINAMEAFTSAGEQGTPDMGGQGTTLSVARAIADTVTVQATASF